jgi:hypothetical protein
MRASRYRPCMRVGTAWAAVITFIATAVLAGSPLATFASAGVRHARAGVADGALAPIPIRRATVMATPSAQLHTASGGLPYPTVNSVAPAFQTAIGVTSAANRPDHGELHSILIRPVSVEPIVVCNTCRKDFYIYQEDNKSRAVLTVQPAQLVTPETRFLVMSNRALPASVASQQGIGRYRLYGFDPATRSLQTLAQGCLAAWTPQFYAGFRPTQFTPAFLRQTLPVVPCQATVPTHDSLSLTPPPELFESSTGTFAISGFSSGPRWLTVSAGAACNAVPLFTVSAGGGGSRGGPANPRVSRVSGHFEYDFTFDTPARPDWGNFCAFLQTGGRYKEVPDGRLTARAAADWNDGDTAIINAPETLPVGQVLSFTVSGYHNSDAAAYEYFSFRPCASTAQAEKAIGQGGQISPASSTGGNFSQRFQTSGPLPQSAYICAYIQPVASTGTDTNPPPSGQPFITAIAKVTLQ